MIARLGDKEIIRAYQGENVIYPTPIRDGLVLWYDFKGRTNQDINRGVAVDLSGNGNHGELQNFAYGEGSGYGNGLVFDGVDDRLYTPIPLDSLGVKQPITFEIALIPSLSGKTRAYCWYGFPFEYGIFTHTYFYFNNWGIGYAYFERRSTNEARFLSFVAIPERKTYLYIDGVKLLEVDESRDLFQIDSIVFAHGYGVSGDIKMYSFRLYNRALSPEEIAHNYQLEKERWNLS